MTDNIEVRVKFTKGQAQRIRGGQWSNEMLVVQAALLKQHPEEPDGEWFSARRKMSDDRVVVRKVSSDGWHLFAGDGYSWVGIRDAFTDIRPLSLDPPKYDEAKVDALLVICKCWVNAGGCRSDWRDFASAVEAFDDD